MCFLFLDDDASAQRLVDRRMQDANVHLFTSPLVLVAGVNDAQLDAHSIEDADRVASRDVGLTKGGLVIAPFGRGSPVSQLEGQRRDEDLDRILRQRKSNVRLDPTAKQARLTARTSVI